MKRWNKRITKKITAWLLCGALLGTMGTSNVQATSTSQVVSDNTNIDANGTLGKNSDVGIEVTKSITGTIGKSVKVSFNLKSGNADTIQLKSVYPVIDAAFPFETSGDAYKVITADGDAAKQSVLAAEYELTARSDLETGYQSVKFIGEYTKIAADGTATDYYVIKTINIYFSGTGTKPTVNSGKTDNDKKTESVDTDDEDDDFDSSGGYDYNAAGGSDEVEAPKLIITGYDAEPEKIMAGQSFKITIHIQNSSKKTNVCNAKFLVGDEAGNFLPTSGSNAVFVEKIAAGETGDVAIELKTSAELAQKNYRLVVKGDFDDGNGNSFSASESVYIPVYQEVKLAVTDVSMSPESIGIGSQGSLMFTINNQSGSGIYNVKVAAKDDAVTGEECYVGNIAGNSSAYATLNIVGEADNSDSGTIKVVISYEDTEGNVEEVEQELACSVGVDSYEEVFDDLYDDYDDDYESGTAWWVYLVLGLVVLAVIVGIIIFLVRTRKKKLADLLEDDSDDDFFGDTDTDDDLISVTDTMLQSQDDTILVEGNEQPDIENGEDDTEDENF